MIQSFAKNPELRDQVLQNYDLIRNALSQPKQWYQKEAENFRDQRGAQKQSEPHTPEDDKTPKA